MTVGSLFSGIGGLELGFEWAGFQVRWQVEREPFCQAVLAKHWPDVPRYDDVREVGAHNLEPVDVIVGGFPCQDVSDAGQRVGIDGARSGLWAEYARIVGELRPRFVVVENVRGLLARGMGRVLGDLAALGYDAEWTTLRASDVGAPHKRERVFIVAYPTGQRVERRAGGPGDSGHADERDPAVDDAAEPRLEGDQPGTGNEGDVQWGTAGSTCGDDAAELGDTERSITEAKSDPQHDQGAATVGQASQLGGTGASWECRWPARPGEAQHAWEPPRVLRRTESGVGVVPDGLPAGLVRHRRRALAALGNAVVPQVAYLVALRVLELHREG